MKNKLLIIIIAILLLTNIGTGWWAWTVATGQDHDHAANIYPLIDPTRDFIPQKDFIVNIQPLRDKLEAIYKEFGEENVSLYLEVLNSGANTLHNPDARFYPASLIKLPIAIAAAKQVEDGVWQWDSELVLFEQDIDSRYGSVSKQPIGTQFTIERLLELLLVESDNTAFNILIRNLGIGKVNEYLQATGLETLFDKRQNITAREFTRTLRSLYVSSYLKREYSQKILALMDKSQNVFMSKAIGEDVPFAHKFGSSADESVYLDSGIVYVPGRPYMLTVLYKPGKNVPESRINEFFERVGRETYEYFRDF